MLASPVHMRFPTLRRSLDCIQIRSATPPHSLVRNMLDHGIRRHAGTTHRYLLQGDGFLCQRSQVCARVSPRTLHASRTLASQGSLDLSTSIELRLPKKTYFAPPQMSANHIRLYSRAALENCDRRNCANAPPKRVLDRQLNSLDCFLAHFPPCPN